MIDKFASGNVLLNIVFQIDVEIFYIKRDFVFEVKYMTYDACNCSNGKHTNIYSYKNKISIKKRISFCFKSILSSRASYIVGHDTLGANRKTYWQQMTFISKN